MSYYQISLAFLADASSAQKRKIKFVCAGGMRQPNLIKAKRACTEFSRLPGVHSVSCDLVSSSQVGIWVRGRKIL